MIEEARTADNTSSKVGQFRQSYLEKNGILWLKLSIFPLVSFLEMVLLPFPPILSPNHPVTPNLLSLSVYYSYIHK